MQTITASVGHGGTNRATDVKTVQQLLNRHKIPGYTIPLKEDGSVGPKTIERIEAFQKYIVKLIRPDGRVDPNGRSLSALNQVSTASSASTKVTYATNVPAAKQLVSGFALSVVQLALRNAGMPQAVITSTLRTPDEQARIMFSNAKKDFQGQLRLYGSTGDEVLMVYKNNQTQPELVVIKLMQEKIEALLKQGRRTSNHVVTTSEYQNLNIFDIGVNSTRAVCGVVFSIEKFTQALYSLKNDGYIYNLIDETKKTNSCWHLEIKPNIKPLPNQ